MANPAKLVLQKLSPSEEKEMRQDLAFLTRLEQAQYVTISVTPEWERFWSQDQWYKKTGNWGVGPFCTRAPTDHSRSRDLQIYQAWRTTILSEEPLTAFELDRAKHFM